MKLKERQPRIHDEPLAPDPVMAVAVTIDSRKDERRGRSRGLCQRPMLKDLLMGICRDKVNAKIAFP